MPILGAMGAAAARAFGLGRSADAPSAELYSFSSFTFTNAGATGTSGPSLAQCQSAYSGAAFLASYFTVTNGTQVWTCPKTGTYEIECVGANGGSNIGVSAGRGAKIVTRVTLTQGVQYNIIVGQCGHTGGGSGGHGGGASWVFTGNVGDGTLIVSAGGGGGTGHDIGFGGNGSSTNSPTSGGGRGTGGSLGTGYGGKYFETDGGQGTWNGPAGGGAGWLSDGTDARIYSGTGSNMSTFSNIGWKGTRSGVAIYGGGKNGATTTDCGGFGGGAGGGGSGLSGGGGGGYSGGGGGANWPGTGNPGHGGGGGGGSYWTGTLQSATAGGNTAGSVASLSNGFTSANGYVKITILNGIYLISGTTYDATSVGPVTSIDDLTSNPTYSSLPTSGFLKYTIAKSTGNQTITVAYQRNGTTISQSAFSLLGASLSYPFSTSSILFYGNDDHDSMFMDADGRGVIARTNTNFFSGNWDKFQATTEVTVNSSLDSVVVYPASSFMSSNSGTFVSFPKTNSGIWINLTAGTYKVNNLTSQSLNGTFTGTIGTAAPANSLYTISDGVNQFIVGRWNTTAAILCTVNLSTGVITTTSITWAATASQNNLTEEDAVGTQLFTVDGTMSFHSGGIFYYGGTRPWKDVTASPVSTSGKSTFAAGNSTQTDMDIFGSIGTDRYVWFADWGHDDGGLFTVGNDSQLGTRKTNIIHIDDSYTN
jgi:hypothetical protein